MRNTETPTRASLGRRLAGAAAIIFAVSVVGCRIYDAQVAANARAQPGPTDRPMQGPLAEPAIGEVHEATEVPAGMLPSSKGLVLSEDQPVFLPSSKFLAIPPASGKARRERGGGEFLPSSKSMVINPDDLSQEERDKQRQEIEQLLEKANAKLIEQERSNEKSNEKGAEQAKKKD